MYVGGSRDTTNETWTSFACPIACTITQMYIRGVTGPSSGVGSIVATLRLDAADTLCTCTAGVASGGQLYSANDTSHSISVTAGQLIAVKYVHTGSAASTTFVYTLKVQ
jgi:hypothetical protein